MGQDGSIPDNKSIILSNWIQMKQNSNIFFNKVTNQQIQRHQVLINNKNQLTSYIDRMQDQSALICRLIYFHPKSMPKDQESKKSTKITTHLNPHNDIKVNARTKSILSDQILQQNQHQKNSLPTNDFKDHETFTKIYCVYTDRMVTVKEWNKDKIINVIQAFKKLIKTYGLFKVRQHCISQNQRKQIKIWINENPVTNFPLQSVQSQQDMIADLAALLVSRKQKIAKQLLDLQNFDQAIEHLYKLPDYDNKKFVQSPNSTIIKTNNLNLATNRQSESSVLPPSQVNNFYNVFINTDHNYTVGNSLQSSKYNIINKSAFGNGNPYYSQKTNPPPPSKDSDHQQIKKKQIDQRSKFKTQHNVQVKKQHSPPYSPLNYQNLSPNSSVVNRNKIQQKPVSSHPYSKSHVNNSGISNPDANRLLSPPLLQIDDQQSRFYQRQIIQNTSIMMQTDKGLKHKQSQRIQLYNTQKGYSSKEQYSLPVSEKNTEKNLGLPSYTNYTTQNQKVIPTTHQQLQTRSKNNSSGDITENNKKIQHSFINDRINLDRNQINLQNKKNVKKQFFSNNEMNVSTQKYLTPQFTAKQGNNILVPTKEKLIEMQRNPNFKDSTHHTYSKTNEQEFQNQRKGLLKTDYNPSGRSQSKVVGKSSYEISDAQHYHSTQNSRNVVSQMSTLKTPNSFIYQNGNSSNLNKKSFPKYFQEKQSAKSIQKYYEKSLEQRQKSKALINKMQHKVSPNKYLNAFVGMQNFSYQALKAKDITQQIVMQVHESEACSQQIIPPPQSNQNTVGFKSQAYQQRRKFPSTMQKNSKKVAQLMPFQQQQSKRKTGTQIDSQQSYTASYQGTKSNFLVPPHQSPQPEEQNKPLKKSNNTCFDTYQHKQALMMNSYFGNLNTNNSLLIVHKPHYQIYKDKVNGTKNIYQTDIKKRKNFDFIVDKDDQDRIKWKLDHQGKYTEKNSQIDQQEYHKTQINKIMNQLKQPRQSLIETQIDDRKMSFPIQEHFIQKSFIDKSKIQRKIQKNFTFYNSTQKPTGVELIQQIKPFEQQKSKFYQKNESMKSNDQQTLPRTTADQRQKRMFKATRTSEILDAQQLHKSDPGHKIQQLTLRIQKQRLNNGINTILNEKLDSKQNTKFNKWESLNVYGSLINHSSYGSSMKKFKKQEIKSQKQRQYHTNYDGESKNQDDKDIFQKSPPSMVVSQNLQTKKKIRKQVLLDYKDLFGEQAVSQQPTLQQLQKARKQQIKKRKQQQERMLQNTSSKDLLIQQKVQKQKQKHAQLKNDLSKLFTQQF